ncbi:hypothetical protein [uncultured Methanobrevibacter sp.]|uniref:hypothetical protein n=1 Tax=uncultured Methanobrevibacter sp. TaxID=253161 RepID=UPI0025FD55CD|nr:hypothetical protein [uncultured Methanobrevibacter sp.]
MKKILISILLLILTIGAVSAADENITSDNLTVSKDLQIESSTDEILSENEEGTFQELSDLIKNTPDAGTLKLDKNYANSKSGGEITISKSITIDGDGHILDSNSASRIFKVQTPDTVILKNIIFKNGNSKNGGAIALDYESNIYSSTYVDNCTFINCQADESGAIYFERGYMYSDGGHGVKYGVCNSKIINCNFINCTAKNNGGAMCFYDYTKNGIIDSCNFINCTAKNNGGAVYFYPYMSEDIDMDFTYYYFNSQGVINNCSFLNCNAKKGGAIYIGRDYITSDFEFLRYFGAEINSTVSNCDFMNCYSNLGGSIYWDSIQGKIENSKFTSSRAKNGGAVYACENIDLGIANSTFINNTATEFGSAVYGGLISNCSFNGNTDPEIYNLYNLTLDIYKNQKISNCIIGITLPRDTIGNFSLYVLDGEEYKFADSVNITGSTAEINFKSPKVGDIKIKTITNTNYGVFESYEQISLTSIEFEESYDGRYYLNSIYTVKTLLPEDAKGNFSLYVNNELYECVNLTYGGAEIRFITLKEGKYCLEAVCNSNYGLENASNEIRFEDGRDLYIRVEVMFYNEAKKLEVDVLGINSKPVAKNTPITVKIGSTTIKAKTDAYGTAKVNIPKLKPGKYTITARYGNVKVTDKLIVNHIVTLKSVKFKKSAKKLTLQATLKNSKAIKGKTVTFKFNGKIYKAKTNSKGIAKVTIKSNVLKKLKAGKKVTYQATYLKDTVKKTDKVQK